jgi:Putative NADP-dependent oxidoreductases
LFDGNGVRKLDIVVVLLIMVLGVLGMLGLTGYVGMVYLGESRFGQMVVVFAVIGLVGSTVG